MARLNFKKLNIWIEEIKLVTESYKLTLTFPKYERYGLISQMNRCALSIPSNIAEGSSKSTDKHFLKYIEDSLGSAFEWKTQLVVARNINYISEESFKLLEDKIIQLQKMISRFQDRLS
ncbi:MAG: four helix bundle protein [Flavobacteriaceae bacterium]|nr:four helix bundle protein [Flavobacteriaceae bacterium]